MYVESNFNLYFVESECFWLLFIEAQAGYAYIYNFCYALWVCFLIFPPFDVLSKIGACPRCVITFYYILTICCLSRLHSSPLYPCPESPGNCWVDQATCEISDWTWTPSPHLSESSHYKSKLCSASGLWTFNTFCFKGLWSVIVSYFIGWYPVSTGKERNKTVRRKLWGTQAREIGTTHMWYQLLIN